MRVFRGLARRCHIAPREALTLTLSQALALLDDPDPADPHRGNRPFDARTIEDLRAMSEG